MYLTRHVTPVGSRWAFNGCWLPSSFTLGLLLEVRWQAMPDVLRSLVSGEPAEGPVSAPLDPAHEVWAAGVTYLRSRQAREAESASADVYARVYEAARPELFFKSPGWRVVGHGGSVRVRRDSRWNVPEPELTLVINRHGEIVGYTAGDDVSSRDIEGENPLYLPQAKIYDGSCALGPGIVLAAEPDLADVPIVLEVARGGMPIFRGETSTTRMKRTFGELAAYLVRELAFPHGVLLMTGTGIVPGDDFSLQPGDLVRIRVGELTLENPVAA